MVDAGSIEAGSGPLGQSPDLIFTHMLIGPPSLTRSKNSLKVNSLVAMPRQPA